MEVPRLRAKAPVAGRRAGLAPKRFEPDAHLGKDERPRLGYHLPLAPFPEEPPPPLEDPLQPPEELLWPPEEPLLPTQVLPLSESSGSTQEIASTVMLSKEQ